MKLERQGQVIEVQAKLVRRLSAIGWKPVEEKQADDEVIRLKPPVKTKATVKALDEAKQSKGDE
jgi:hypothetical protein